MRNEEPRKRERLCSYSFLILRDRREPTSFYSVYPFSLLSPSSLLFTFKLHLPLQHDVIDGCDSLFVFDLHITGIIYFFFIGEKRFLFFVFQVGRYITAVFSVGKENGGICGCADPPLGRPVRRRFWETTTRRRKERKMTSPSLPSLKMIREEWKKQLNVQTRYIV